MGKTMKIYGCILSLLFLVSCASTNERKIASDPSIKKEIERSVFHDLRMSQSHLATAKANGYRKYLSSLSVTELENLQLKIKSLKSQSKEIHQQVTDWMSTLSQAEILEIKRSRD